MMVQKKRPIVGTVIGDPAGIGPEVVVKALASGKVHESSIPLLIGSAAAIERAIDFTGFSIGLRVMSKLEKLSDDPEVIDILDTGALASSNLPLGEDTVRAGEATAQWLVEMDDLARNGKIDATVLAPISTDSLKLADRMGPLGKIMSSPTGESYLVLLTGLLRVAHLTDHMPLREVCETISSDQILNALRQVDSAMRGWGVVRPRIVVAGLNPHAMGNEERDAIAPGVNLARSEGIDVVGPESPDSVFRQCIDGRYDIVLAMYHDQGHIAVKTWGFSGNSVIVIGPPYLHMSVAHGTAYDIVGQGIADSSMMLKAMRTAGFLAGGCGFPDEG